MRVNYSLWRIKILLLVSQREKNAIWLFVLPPCTKELLAKSKASRIQYVVREE